MRFSACSATTPRPHPGWATAAGRSARRISGDSSSLPAFAAVAAMTLVTRWQPSTFENRPKKSLAVSGGRTVSGMVITNRETEPLSDCVVRVGPRRRIERLDGGGRETSRERNADPHLDAVSKRNGE